MAIRQESESRPAPRAASCAYRRRSPPFDDLQRGESTMPHATKTAVPAAATCPVCDWALGTDARDVAVGDATVRVCCDECAREVALSPTKYLRR
jgi:hypothetical protein